MRRFFLLALVLVSMVAHAQRHDPRDSQIEQSIHKKIERLQRLVNRGELMQLSQYEKQTLESHLRSAVQLLRDDNQGPGPLPGGQQSSAYLRLSVDRQIQLRIDRNGISVVSSDGDYRTGLREQSVSPRASFFSIQSVQIIPRGATRVSYGYSVQNDRHGSYILLTFTDPAGGAGEAMVDVLWR